MAAYTTETILQIQHWSDKLFSFRTTRAAGLRFENGQFVMLGLPMGDRKIVRAYSIASANYEEHLEFYSIKVPGGGLTSHLQHLTVGCSLLVSSKPTGTLVTRDLRPGRRLFLLATGTGIAPFMSIVRDPATYDGFEQVILARGVRFRADLAYGDSVLAALRQDPYLGAAASARLIDYPCISREPCAHVARVTTAVESGRLCTDLNIEPMDPRTDRVMICGNIAMLTDTMRYLNAAGFEVSPQIGATGDYVIERAYADSQDRKVAA